MQTATPRHDEHVQLRCWEIEHDAVATSGGKRRFGNERGVGPRSEFSGVAGLANEVNELFESIGQVAEICRQRRQCGVSCNGYL